jgi:rhodanese-related sulfurtransferase
MKHAPQTQQLSPADLANLMRARAIQLVDVREPAEHEAERIEGAVSHPLSSFDPVKLPPGEVVFHCGSGKRSLAAIERCTTAGLAHASHLQGGIAAWKQAGLPTKQG